MSELDLLFKIKADGSQSAAEITRLRALFASEFGQMGALGTGALKGINREITSLASSVPVIGLPLAGITRSFLNLEQSSTPAIRKLSKELESARASVVKFEAEVAAQFDGKITGAFLRLYNVMPQLGERINSQTPRFKAAFDALGGDASALLPKLEKAGEEFALLEGKIASASGAVAAAGSGMAALAVPVAVTAGVVLGLGGAALLTAMKVGTLGDEIYKVERKTSFSAGTLSTLSLTAREVGINFTEVGTALARFEKNIVSAEGSNKKLASAFRNLGIDATVAAKNPEEAFSKFLKAFNALPPGADRAAIAIQLFGKSGANLIPLFDEIGDSLDAARERTRRLGLFLGEDAVNQAHQFEVSMRDAKASLEGLEIQIGQKTLPVIERFIEGLSGAAEGGQGFAGHVGGFIGNVVGEFGRALEGAGQVGKLYLAAPIKENFDLISTSIQETTTRAKGFGVALGDLKNADLSGFNRHLEQSLREADQQEADYLERSKTRSKEWLNTLIEAVSGFNNRNFDPKTSTPPPGAPSLDPSKKSAPLVSALPKTEDDPQKRLDLLKQAEEESKRIAQDQTDAAKRALAERVIDEQKATGLIIEAQRTRTNSNLAALSAEREMLTEQRKDRATDTSDAAKRQKELDAIDKQLIENQQKTANAQSEFERFRLDKQSELRQKERDAEATHRKAMQGISDDADRIRTEKIKALPIADSEKEKRIAQIENGGFDRRRLFLERERDLAGANTRLRQQFNDQIAALDQQQTAAQVRQAEARRVASVKEFEEGIRLRELHFQTQGEQVRRFAAKMRAEAEAGARGFNDAEKQIFDAEEVFYKDQIELISDRIADALKRGNAKLKEELEERKLLLIEQRDANRDAAVRTVGTPTAAGTTDVKDTERANQRAAVLRGYYVNIADIVRAGEAIETREMATGLTSREVIIQREFKSSREVLQARYRQEQDALNDRLKIISVDETARKKNASEIEAINKTLVELMKKFNLDLKVLGSEEQKTLERANSGTARAIFGDKYAEAFKAYNKSLVDAGKQTNNFRASLFGMGATAQGVFEQLSANAGNMGTMLGDVFGNIGQGLASTAEAFLVTGELSGKALAKQLVQTLAHLSVESGVKALYETAAGFAALAVGDAPAADAHFTAATFYGDVAIDAGVAAVVGSALTGQRGEKSDSSVAAGGRALGYGQSSGGSSTPTSYPAFNYGGQTFSSSQVGGQGSRDTATAAALNNVAIAVKENTQATVALQNRIGSVRQDEIITNNPMAVGDALETALDNSHRVSRTFYEKSGYR